MLEKARDAAEEEIYCFYEGNGRGQLCLSVAEARSLFEMGLNFLQREPQRKGLEAALYKLAQRLLRDSTRFQGDVAVAFILGARIAEIVEYNPVMEEQEQRRQKATETRIADAKRRRQAIIAAAAKVYKEEPRLRRSHYETAVRIWRMELKALLTSKGRKFIGPDAIVKHIRAAHEDGHL